MSDIEYRLQQVEVSVKELTDWAHQADVREAARHSDMTALQREVTVLRTTVKDRLDRQDINITAQFEQFNDGVQARFDEFDKKLKGVQGLITKMTWIVGGTVVTTFLGFGVDRLVRYVFG